MDPVKCAKGHLNDPYPDTGRCVVSGCNLWLPGNKNIMTTEKQKETVERKKTGTKAHKETARQIVADDGFEWDDIGEGNRTLVMNWVVRNDRASYVLYLEQMRKRLAAPKASEKVEDIVIEVHVSDELLRSLEVLNVSRDRSQDL
ncbi:hypothetical protein LCGC14_1020860 [marine sediment metagenome]|uniref:Uncharacterized protein n=1 Tax=marine sediment metagenome TaxID=412755 RepID=A0A0F9R3D1_9ZZZZ